MSAIHDVVLEKLRSTLQAVLITNLFPTDPTIAGVVQIGPPQDKGPDELRISVSLFTNDPDSAIAGNPSEIKNPWNDEVYDLEIGHVVTMTRRFSLKARCLFSTTRENADLSRQYANTVRDRIEDTLFKMSWAGTRSDNGEFVSMGVMQEDYQSEMLQAGGPPDAYDYLIKVRFSILTTK